MPLLSQAVPQAEVQSQLEVPAPEVGEEEVEEAEEDVPTKKAKKGKGGGGGGGGKKSKAGKGKKEDKEDKDKGDKEEEGGEVVLIDEIWPKKEALGLTKWCVFCCSCSSSPRLLPCGSLWRTMTRHTTSRKYL